MLYKMYSVRDSAAETFHPPWFKSAHGEAERDFKMLVNEPKATVGRFPEHYSLYYVGTYESNTGEINALATPEFALRAIDLVDKNMTPMEV